MVALTIIIVSHGKEERLMKCLDTISPGEMEWQLIILSSKDLSPETEAKASSLTPNFQNLKTSGLTPGKALNSAIEISQGEWICITDESAYFLKGYWDKAVSLIKESKIDVFGGPEVPALGMKSSSLAYSIALSSPLCSGPTFSRHKSQGTKLQYADEEKLSHLNLWIRKSTLEQNPFPEHYESAEEIVLLQKLKQEGKGVFYDPKLRVAFHRDADFGSVVSSSFSGGQSRSKLMREKKSNAGGAYWLPAAFVLLHLLIFLDAVSFWYLARMYASIILFISIALSMQVKRPMLFLLVSLYHYVVVFFYGTGFISERLGLLGKRK